jgi:hypothetical protein
MLRLLIVEPDPLISLDLAEAASHRMAGAIVDEVSSVGAARVRLAGGAGLTHMFIRKPGAEQAAETYAFISEMADKGVITVLVGADHPPRDMPPIPRLTHMSFPFTTEVLESVFRMRFH